MIRATVTSAVDQALLSALNFGLAVLLIHYASKEEYGLYAQLVSLQSFFSPLHAGIFVSAYLSLASNLSEARHIAFRTSMARAEMTMTTLSTVVLMAAFALTVRLIPTMVPATNAPGTYAAFSIALLGLWWREFTRQIQFATLNYGRALGIDAVYCVATLAAFTLVLTIGIPTSGAAFWCMAFGGILASAGPLVSATRGSPVGMATIRQDMRLSWKTGRWEVMGSIITWGYAQSYVFFAAVHGGLDAAAEISAARLLATPLALMWASYANVLRPSASMLLTAGSVAAIRRLAIRSVIFVLVISGIYSLGLLTFLPILERTFFSGSFRHLGPLTLCWTIYFTLTGISTVASSVLRSALEFRRVFHRQFLSCIAAVLLLTVGLHFAAIESLVIALIVVEAISAGLFWHRLTIALSPRLESV